MSENSNQWIEAFNLFDKNKKGYITSKELRVVIKFLDRNITESELQDMIAWVAGHGHRTIGLDVFVELKELKLNDIDSEEELTGAFKVFDMDRDGSISQAELRHIMHNLGDKLTDEEAEEMIREADTDGDGLVSFEKFKRMMLNI